MLVGILDEGEFGGVCIGLEEAEVGEFDFFCCGGCWGRGFGWGYEVGGMECAGLFRLGGGGGDGGGGEEAEGGLEWWSGLGFILWRVERVGSGGCGDEVAEDLGEAEGGQECEAEDESEVALEAGGHGWRV